MFLNIAANSIPYIGWLQQKPSRWNAVGEKSSRAAGDPETRVRLATFAAIQKLRTDAHRQQHLHLGELLRQTLHEREGLLPPSILPPTTKEQSYAEAIRMIPYLTKSALPHILKKSWILYETTAQHLFYISDNPVTLYNTLNQNDLRVTLGLAVPGIEIYLPLSDTLCLGLLCLTVEAWLRDSLAQMERTHGPQGDIDTLRSMISALDGKSVHRFDPPANLTFLRGILEVVNVRVVTSQTDREPIRFSNFAPQ